MQIAHEVYVTTVKGLPTNEQLELASLILAGVTQKHNGSEVMPMPKTARRSMRQILDELPGGRIFKTPEEVDAYLREERDSWER